MKTINDLEDIMNYTHELSSDIAIFRLEGNMLGNAGNNQLKDEVIAYLDKGTSKFIMDLTDLKHINSTGLGVFITLLTKIKSKNGEMVLSNPSSTIANLLKITKLTSVFQVFQNLEEAISSLSKS